MNNIFKIISFILILVVNSTLYSHMYEKEGLEILHPWSSASTDGNANAYLTISNNTNDEIALVKVITKVSDMTMIMSNKKMIKQLIVPPNSIRSSDDFHIMLHNIENKLIHGNAFPAKLIFSSGLEIKIKFVIGETTSLDEAEDKADHHQHH